MGSSPSRLPSPIVTLLTDFGLSDHYVAAMKGSVLSICRDAQLVDVSHQVAPYQIAEAAYLLSQAWTAFPQSSIHVVVVDPGVGSSRRPILVEAAGHYFIAPDNGVLAMVLNAIPGWEARHITAEQYFRHPVSQTFHGRDIFAPVAGHLGAGVPASSFGERVTDLIGLHVARPAKTAEETWEGSVLHIDRFGNVVTNFDRDTFSWVRDQAFELSAGGQNVRQYSSAYATASSGPFLIQGSGGFLEVSENRAAASKTLNVTPGTPLTLRRF